MGNKHSYEIERHYGKYIDEDAANFRNYHTQESRDNSMQRVLSMSALNVLELSPPLRELAIRDPIKARPRKSFCRSIQGQLIEVQRSLVAVSFLFDATSMIIDNPSLVFPLSLASGIAELSQIKEDILADPRIKLLEDLSKSVCTKEDCFQQISFLSLKLHLDPEPEDQPEDDPFLDLQRQISSQTRTPRRPSKFKASSPKNADDSEVVRIQFDSSSPILFKSQSYQPDYHEKQVSIPPSLQPFNTSHIRTGRQTFTKQHSQTRSSNEYQTNYYESSSMNGSSGGGGSEASTRRRERDSYTQYMEKGLNEENMLAPVDQGFPDLDSIQSTYTDDLQQGQQQVMKSFVKSSINESSAVVPEEQSLSFRRTSPSIRGGGGASPASEGHSPCERSEEFSIRMMKEQSFEASNVAANNSPNNEEENESSLSSRKSFIFEQAQVIGMQANQVSAIGAHVQEEEEEEDQHQQQIEDKPQQQQLLPLSNCDDSATQVPKFVCQSKEDITILSKKPSKSSLIKLNGKQKIPAYQQQPDNVKQNPKQNLNERQGWRSWQNKSEQSPQKVKKETSQKSLRSSSSNFQSRLPLQSKSIPKSDSQQQQQRGSSVGVAGFSKLSTIFDYRDKIASYFARNRKIDFQEINKKVELSVKDKEQLRARNSFTSQPLKRALLASEEKYALRQLSVQAANKGLHKAAAAYTPIGRVGRSSSSSSATTIAKVRVRD